ncbi:unnamed protein product [Ixodes persulcatus]
MCTEKVSFTVRNFKVQFSSSKKTRTNSFSKSRLGTFADNQISNIIYLWHHLPLAAVNRQQTASSALCACRETAPQVNSVANLVMCKCTQPQFREAFSSRFYRKRTASGNFTR